MKVYLDSCCLGRLFEESDQPRVNEECSAMERILEQELEFVSSEAVAFEIARDSDEERRDAKRLLDEEIRSEVVKGNDAIIGRARELAALGFKAMDAMHISCAEAAGAALLLTIDDRFLKRARRFRAALKVEVDNPVSWVLRFPEP
jgi:predicted nucleic acid-binding protein